MFQATGAIIKVLGFVVVFGLVFNLDFVYFLFYV